LASELGGRVPESAVRHRQTASWDKHADVAQASWQRSGDGASCLVLTQINAEVDLLNEAIRKELSEKNLLNDPLFRLRFSTLPPFLSTG
jgi:hypothetical protein